MILMNVLANMMNAAIVMGKEFQRTFVSVKEILMMNVVYVEVKEFQMESVIVMEM